MDDQGEQSNNRRWTEDDRSIRSLIGSAAVTTGAILVAPLLLKQPYDKRVAEVLLIATITLAVAFLFWPRITARLRPEGRIYQSLLTLASQTRIWFGVLAFLMIYFLASALVERYRDIMRNPLPGNLPAVVPLAAKTGAVAAIPPSTAASENADARLLPFSKPDFFKGLPADPAESFRMVCFAYDPWSCNIAARYRDRLAEHWTPERTVISDMNPAPIKGITIGTRSERRPAGALALRQGLRDLGMEVGFPIDPKVIKAPNEFVVIVGGNPS